MFKFSNYIEKIEETVDGERRLSLFSYRSKKSFKLSHDDYEMILAKRFEDVSVEVLEELIRNKVLLPDDEPEGAQLINELLSYDKVTIVITDSTPIDFDVLRLFLQQKCISLISFLFYDCSTDLINRVIAYEGLAFDRPGNKVKRHFFSLVSGDSRLQLKEIIVDKGEVRYGKVLNQFIIDGSADANIGEVYAENDNVKISIVTPDPNLFSKYSDRVVFFKAPHNTSVISSSLPRLKELPISGLIVEVQQLSTVSELNLSNRCASCKYLAACGGYLENSVVQCPSYTHFSFQWRLLRQILKGQFSEEREKKQLDIFNDAGIIMLNEFIDANEPLKDRLYGTYIVSEYDRGFLLSKARAFNTATAVFGVADRMLTGLDEASFLYRFTQLWATSTKSYLVYKKGGYEQALEILRMGIKFGLSIQHNKKAEVLILYFTQMLYNVAKVYLIAGIYSKWQYTISQIFNFLLNFEVADECEGLEITLTKSLDAKFRYKAVVDTIGDILYRKELAIKPYRDVLLSNIRIRKIENRYDEKIQGFSNLYKALLDQNESYVTLALPAFYQNPELDPLIASLQVLFRIKNKRTLDRFHHSVQH